MWSPPTERQWRRVRRLALTMLLAGIVGLYWPAAVTAKVQAHADLVRSEPAANSVVPVAPAELHLWFSEPPEPRLSQIALYTSESVRVATGSAQAMRQDKYGLSVPLKPLLPGTYTVAWNMVSTVDGHATTGALVFAVGSGQNITAPASGVLTSAGPDAGPSRFELVLRWLTYLAMAITLGALSFGPLVLDPALQRQAQIGPEGSRWPDAVRLTATRRGLALAWIGLCALAALSVLSAVEEARVAARVSLDRALAIAPESPLMTLLFSTSFGHATLGRLLVLCALAVLLVRLRPSRRIAQGRSRALWLAASGLAALVALTMSLASHAAGVASSPTGVPPIAPVLSDWVHLTATGLWVGGLWQLAVAALPATAAAPGWRAQFLAALVPSFSRLATVSVAALLITGLYQSILQVGSWGAFFGTDYGRALTVKLLLVVPLLLLGAYNLLWAQPQLTRSATKEHESIGETRTSESERSSASLAHSLRLAVTTESALAVAVLLAASVLALTRPGAAAWAERSRGVTENKTAADLRVGVQIDPARAGLNTFSVTVRDAFGRPVADANTVALVLTLPKHDMGPYEITLTPRGGGVYWTATGLASMSGVWQTEVLVRRAGHPDVRTPFQVRLADPVAASSPS